MSYFQFSFMPDKSTSDVVLPMENVQNIISKLDSKKVDENKLISICTAKLSNKSISFYINFKFCLMQGIFPSKWVKDNCTNTKEKKNGKHCVTNELVKQCVKNSHQRIIYNIKLWFCLEDNIIPPNLYPILIKHFLILTTRLDGYSLKCQSLWIMCGTCEVFLNLNVMRFWEIC